MSDAPPGDAPVKRYLDVAHRLIGEIVDGAYPVGGLLPTELELAELHGASRHTIRAALTVLQERGYISRRKSLGTRVESANPTQSYVHTVDTVDDLVRTASTEVRSIESVRVVTLDRATARRLGAPFDSSWMRFSGPRIDARKRTPVSWVDIYVDVAFAGIEDQVRSNPIALVSDIIEREYGQRVAEVRQIVYGTLIEDPLARTLGVAAGSAGLRILRHYKDDSQRMLEVTETISPADRVSVSVRLRRGRSG
ncbi:MAG: GntR family transcriptional regulator [Burkholderiaceae bacterium]